MPRGIDPSQGSFGGQPVAALPLRRRRERVGRLSGAWVINGTRVTAQAIVVNRRAGDGEIELPDSRLQIGKAAGERMERHDVAN